MVDIKQEPYFDDYDENDNYHKILFVPARAVQVRELNQVQTMVQEQIERLGNHIFENGSIVIPGDIGYNLSYNYVKLNVADLVNVIGQFGNPNITIEGQTTGLTAELKQFINEEGADPFTVYVKYTNGGNSSESLNFLNNETVSIKNQNGDEFATAQVLESGFGSALTVNQGVYYVNGWFVRNETQTIILDKYSSTPSYKVGFDFIETAVTFNEDENLVDNASGTLNFSAPGADRLKIELRLAKYDIETPTEDDEFIEIFRIENGSLRRKARGPEYNILEDELAKRTFYQSGNFTIEPFNLDLRNHPTDTTQYQVGIEAGLAYVKGREVINESTFYIDTDKARETETNNNVALSAPLGYYIEIDTLNIIPNTAQLQEIEIIDDSSATNVTLGYANVRALSKQNGITALHIFNVVNTAGEATTAFLNNATKIQSTSGTLFTANLVGIPEIKDPSDRKSVFSLPNQFVRTLLVNGQSDTTYDFIRQYTLQADASGVVSINASPNEFFPIQNQKYTFAAVIDAGSEQVIQDIASISTSTGSTISINFGAGFENANLRINLVVVKEEAIQKTKTLTNASVTGILTNGALNLDKADGFKLNSVTIQSSSEDITERFKLVENKTQTFYDVSYIELKTGENDPGETIVVNFDYFQHGAGDYFSVDSYSDINYEDIPVEIISGEEIRLTDVLDFRSRIDDTGANFTGAGASISNLPVPDSTVQTDIDYYLPRIDKVYVTERNVFGVKKGSPSLEPKEPKEPSNSMPLYILEVPAYTFDVNSIEIQMINNKKYGMKDIGALEQRIENIEYYTALNNLEKTAADQQIIDSGTGLPRFKNGFIADPFKDHSLADVNNENYQAAVDEQQEELRPFFSPDNVELEINDLLSSNIVKHNNIITLPYSLKNFIRQNQSSETDNVNPYAVFKYIGDLRLSPNSDQWFDITYEDPIYANTTKYIPILNTYKYWWGSWNWNWYGYRYYWWNQPRQQQYKKVTEKQLVGYNEKTIQGTLSSTSTKISDDRIVDVSVTPYMRSRVITFYAKGLRPNTRVYPFFDNIDVNAYCKPNGGNVGDSLITDTNGEITGTFNLPNNSSLKFRSGQRQFVLVDEPNNNVSQSNAYSKTTYTAKGLVDNSQTSITSTSNIETVGLNNDLRQESVAQSFFVDGDGGIFLKEIDLYFSRKDNNATVGIEIREMENGFPGRKVVPYSKVTLRANQVNVSEDASVATTFEFSDPIYLNDETEYCFVILCNSINYEAHFADLGSRDVNTNQIISKKPFEGILFKTTNNRTWSENQTKTFKFNMRKCAFNGTSGSIMFNNTDIPVVRLERDAIKATELSTDVTIKIPNHGLVENSVFELSGVEDNAIIPAVNLNKTHTVLSVVDHNNVIVTVAVNAGDTANIGGVNMEATRNYKYNSFVPYIENLNFDKTSISMSLNGVSSKSIDGVEVAYQNLIYPQTLENKETHNTSRVYSVLSSVDETANFGGNKSLTLTMNMQTQSEDVSPVVDFNRVGFTAINNIVNSPATLDESEGGNALARYITKVVSLNNPSNAIKVFADINRPQNSDIKLYYKTGTSEDELNGTLWTEITPNNSIPVSDGETFREIEFTADNLSSFNIFQIKVVMLSSNSSNIPRIKNFRGIALGT